MAEYIDRTQIKWYGCDHEGKACIDSGGDCAKCFFGNCSHDEVMNMKPADVAPVVHGKWIYDERLTKGLGSSFVRKKIYVCSKCGRAIGLITDIGSKLEDYPYCHCGAKMDKED